MVVDPTGLATSGATVITSAAIALSQQVRQNLSAQVEQAAQKTKEPESTEQQGKPAVEEGSESAKTNDQPQNQAAETESSGGQNAPTRGLTINIEG